MMNELGNLSCATGHDSQASSHIFEKLERRKVESFQGWIGGQGHVHGRQIAPHLFMRDNAGEDDGFREACPVGLFLKGIF